MEIEINDDDIDIKYVPNSTNKKVDINDFEIIKVIGKGSYGKVMLVKNKNTNEYLAMKTLRKRNVKKNKHEIRTTLERKIMEYNEHPFIIQLKYAFQTSSKLYMVMD